VFWVPEPDAETEVEPGDWVELDIGLGYVV